jgi:hypothetical protein
LKVYYAIKIKAGDFCRLLFFSKRILLWFYSDIINFHVNYLSSHAVEPNNSILCKHSNFVVAADAASEFLIDGQLYLTIVFPLISSAIVDVVHNQTK